MPKSYFITGATGLIGSNLTKRLLGDGNKVIAHALNFDKAKEFLSDLDNVSVISGPLENSIDYEGEVDYIIHAGAPTDSKFFMENPVETIDAIALGTKNVLEFAKRKKVKSVVYLSSMEVYGAPTNEEDLTEDQQFYLDPLKIRSDYPMAKRLAENMCVAYASEYGVPVKIARLAQVLGKELLPGDNRVIAQFIRAGIEGNDIKIATDGKTKQTYVAIDDVVNGLLTILYDGKNGDAYNVANDETYCSIKELAELVSRDVSGGKIKVLTNTASDTDKYPPNRTLRLNSTKLRALGWESKVGLTQAIRELANLLG